MSAIVKTFVDGTFTLVDGTSPTPKELVIDFASGNLQVSGLKGSLRETVVIESRGELASLRKGKRMYPTGSFSLFFTEATKGSGAANIIDALTRKTGTSWAAAKSTTEALGDVVTYHGKFTVEGTALGDADDHEFTFEDCEFTFDLTEAESGNTISVSWTQYGPTTGDISCLES